MSKKTVQPPRSRLKINLLFPQGVSLKLPVKFLQWLIAYGRFIIIFVEIIVVAVFVARFKYDADLEDLKDKINARLPYLESLAADETSIRKTQLEINTIKNIYNTNPNWSGFFEQLSSRTPKNVTLSNISLERPENSSDLVFRFSASANSNQSISSLIQGLREEPDIKDINLSGIAFEEGAIRFSISGIKTNKPVNKEPLPQGR